MSYNIKDNNTKLELIRLRSLQHSYGDIRSITGIPETTVRDFINRRTFQAWWEEYAANLQEPSTPTAPNPEYCRVATIDIETSSMLLGGWALFNQNFGLEQIHKDWTIISYSAKWIGDDDVIYEDVSTQTEDELIAGLWNILNEADCVIAHNGKKFDIKKIRARMITLGFPPYSPVKVIDTLSIARHEFGFTSNKLAYLTKLLCKSNIKSSHEKFHGYLLWKEFLAGNPEAIEEMREYNKIDVISLEELYFIIAPWSNKLPNFDVYLDNPADMTQWTADGYFYTNLGKYVRYKHNTTGRYMRGRENLLSKEKRKSLLANIAT